MYSNGAEEFGFNFFTVDVSHVDGEQVALWNSHVDGEQIAFWNSHVDGEQVAFWNSHHSLRRQMKERLKVRQLGH
jgi:hypothetical protein